MVAAGKVKFRIHDKGKTIFRGVMGGISLILYFNAITLTNVSNAVLLSYTYPIFASIFSNIYLNEKLTKEKILFIVSAFAGMFLIFHSIIPRSISGMPWRLSPDLPADLRW